MVGERSSTTEKGATKVSGKGGATRKPVIADGVVAKKVAVKGEASAATTVPKRTTTRKAVNAIVSSEERHRMIAEAAYYRAEKRGFCGGTPEQDWLEASAEVDRLILRERR